jgi:uncharacterized protein (DUF1330 family)
VNDGRPVTLCVLLWAREGEARALVAYEDTVLQFVTTHGGRVLQRVRTDGADDAPLEVHVLQFPTQDALDAYMEDPQRVALAPERDRAIARTEVHRVEIV